MVTAMAIDKPRETSDSVKGCIAYLGRYSEAERSDRARHHTRRVARGRPFYASSWFSRFEDPSKPIFVINKTLRIFSDSTQEAETSVEAQNESLCGLRQAGSQ